MDIRDWSRQCGLNEKAAGLLTDEGFSSAEQLRSVTENDVRLTFQKRQRLPLQQCVALREALKDLQQRSGRKIMKISGPSISEWSEEHELDAETTKMLENEGFTTAEQLRYVTEDDVTLTFLKTRKLLLGQCVALRAALKDNRSPQQEGKKDTARASSSKERAAGDGSRSASSQNHDQQTSLADINEDTEPHHEVPIFTSRGDSASLLTDAETSKDVLRLLVVGSEGSGKSSTANTITGKQQQQQQGVLQSELKYGEWKDCQLQVMDTNGWFEASGHSKDVARKIAKDLNHMKPGPHAILYTVDVSSRYTQKNCVLYENLEAVFCKELSQRLIIVFTHGDVLEARRKRIDDLLEKAPHHMQQVLRECQGRFVVLNNLDSQTAQVDHLVKMVNRLILQNSHKPYLSLADLRQGQKLYKVITSRLAEMQKETVNDTLFVKNRKQELKDLEKSVKHQEKLFEDRSLKYEQEVKKRESKARELEILTEQRSLEAESLRSKETATAKQPN